MKREDELTRKQKMLLFLDGMLSVWDLFGIMPDLEDAERAAQEKRRRQAQAKPSDSVNPVDPNLEGPR